MKLITLCLLSFALCITAEFDKEWWQHATVYDIFLWSFKDSDGDGIGDFAGVTSKMDYLQNLGIKVIKFPQVYSSPDDISNDYKIMNFYDVHSTLGSLEDFDDLISEAQVRGIKIILDINLNHCHSNHEWFQKSIEGIEPYKNYFVWKDPASLENGDAKQPPNFWYTRKSFSLAWNWVEKRKQFYYSVYNYLSPDFNLRNKDLKEELKKILEFWFDKGISGFNIIDKHVYIEEEDVYKKNSKQYDYESLLDLVQELRGFVDNYNEKQIEHERILTTNTVDQSEMLSYSGNKDFPLVHFVTSEVLLNFNRRMIPNAKYLTERIKTHLNIAKDGNMVEWIVYDSIHGRPSNSNSFQCNILNTIAAVLPGIWYLLYGTELGMEYYYKQKLNTFDQKFYLDNMHLLPMQWDDSRNAGFSDSDYPIQFPNPNYWEVNVEKQINDRVSSFKFVKDLLEVREKNALKYGDLNFYEINEMVIAIVRKYKQEEICIALINIANVVQMVELKSSLQSILNLPAQLLVSAASPNFIYEKGDKISISRITMRPFSTVVLMMEKSNK